QLRARPRPVPEDRGGVEGLEIRTRHVRISRQTGDNAGMLPRLRLEYRLRRALDRSRAVALVGARQSGKTTLARSLLVPHEAAYFDLESPVDAARLEQPLLALQAAQSAGGLVVID